MNQYRVSELTEEIRITLGAAFPGNITVTGEVSEAFRSSNGHFYFSLKDEGAKIKAVYFRQFINSGSFIPKTGDEVSVIGELKLYQLDGTYQLMARKIIYSAGGEFWKKFEETRKRLEAEGLFDSARKRAIPDFPRRIALLTAATGAAVKDFIVTARNAGLYFDIDLWPIPVQGKDAAPKIASVIKRAGARTDIYDVLVLTRGGGSLDDLAVFNEEPVARALAGTGMPAISAIGHERDTTICDFVADERVATPTAAAERLCRAPVKAVLNIERMMKRLPDLMLWRMQSASMGLDSIHNRLRSHGAEKLLASERWKLNGLQSKISYGLNTYVARRGDKLRRTEAVIASMSPVAKIQQFINRIDAIEVAIGNAALRRVREAMHKLELTHSKLKLTDPERLLSLGYALVTKHGEVVTGVSGVALEEELEIKMKDGYINTFVTGKRLSR